MQFPRVVLSFCCSEPKLQPSGFVSSRASFTTYRRPSRAEGGCYYSIGPSIVAGRVVPVACCVVPVQSLGIYGTSQLPL